MDENNILRVCKYWAGRFSSSRFGWDELVNVAYIGASGVKEPKHLQAAAKFSIMNFMRDELRDVTYKERRRNVMFKREQFLKNTYYPPKTSENLEELGLAIEKAQLSALDKQLLNMRFVDEMKLEDIAFVLGVTDTTVSNRLIKIIEKLRTNLKRRLK